MNVLNKTGQTSGKKKKEKRLSSAQQSEAKRRGPLYSSHTIVVFQLVKKMHPCEVFYLGKSSLGQGHVSW